MAIHTQTRKYIKALSTRNIGSPLSNKYQLMIKDTNFKLNTPSNNHQGFYSKWVGALEGAPSSTPSNILSLITCLSHSEVLALVRRLVFDPRSRP